MKLLIASDIHGSAFWCRQTGRDPESCDFHDPSQSLWFPAEEVD